MTEERLTEMPVRGEQAADWAMEIDGLSVAPHGREILRVDRLRVPAGQTLVVIGPNGAGKSTLLNACLGFVRPAAGSVAVLGRKITRLAGAALCRLRRRIGYVPQRLAHGGVMPLTVREVVAIGRTGLRGLLRPLRPEDWAAVDEWIERLGLAGLARRSYADLSGGEQRKCLIAKAMVKRPDLLMLDEPTANLDLYWRERIVEVMNELAGRARLTVVLVSHEPQVLPAAAERLLLLEAGRVAADGPPRAVLTPERVGELYGPGLAVEPRGGRLAVVPAADVRAG